jgi:hypothetical protein
MVSNLLKKVFGSRNERLVKKLLKSVTRINDLEPDLQSLTDAALVAKTQEFRQRHATGEDLDSLLPEAFAVVRETGRRVLGMRHFDVQMVGGMVLHQGKIAEMRTGEGKTLVATPRRLSQCPARQGCARRHGQRLPGQTRCRLDGPHLSRPGSERGGYQLLRHHGAGRGLLSLRSPL